MSRPALQSLGESSFNQSDRVSAELFALTYGSFVRQLLLDYEATDDVNKELDGIGYKMGVRLVDDFLAKSRVMNCASFGDTADVIAKVAFKMFLGVSANVTNWSGDRRTFSLAFEDNPLAEFAELPEEHPTLWYSNVLCGVIRGALEMVNMKVGCVFVKCKLRGDEQNEVRVTLHEILVEQVSCLCHTLCCTSCPNDSLRRELLQCRIHLALLHSLSIPRPSSNMGCGNQSDSDTVR